MPAVRFNDIEGLEDPVRVRQAIVDGTNYFYALNRLPLEVEMELSIEPPAATVDLASGTSAAETGCLALTLRPYDLRAFRAAGPSSVAGGSARIPDGFLAELTGRLAEAAQRAAGEPPGSDALVYLARARELLEQGQYARAYFMLQEDWATERSAPSRMQSKAQKERAKKK
ncbi:MAG: hypothetical protein BWZ10_01210 [candidate division BRC1 bacterium ADurb.BinA364]|nr:MAG: hypothetical protein BWZ10_01210 [candidate division BRC1 bacterium ADurb.BinA364]